MKTIYLAGGCFWGLQKFLDQFEGVISTETGYANGSTENPSYEDVRYKLTGHTETVKIVYDETILPTRKLLSYFFMAIDPVSLNKQGEDEGINYRTGIYYTDESLGADVEAVYHEEEKKAGQKLAVEVGPLENYYSAEEYHQKYLDKHPEGYCHISDALLNLRKTLSEAASASGTHS
ncbi:MAG: peptide-methionine (S)-S-oxide reductase MsrA [Eubacteriales bacterium]|nr:peptide-methionine (S)-S-oxide reductase MsrA [Eubacteriales bacterium]